MGVITSAPLRQFIRLAKEEPTVRLHAATPPGLESRLHAATEPGRNTGPLRLPMLRIAVKKQDDIVYFIRVPDPREEVIAEFNKRKRHTGVHAIAMFEDSEQLRTSFEVEANGVLVFRSWEYPEARAEYNRRRKAGDRVDFIRRRARIMDELAIDAEQDGGAA